MQGIEVLYWALSVLFCLALCFAILLWCRGWRKEEHEAYTRQVQLLAREVRRLREAIELLDQAAASIQTADEQISGQVETLRDAARSLKRQTAGAVPGQKTSISRPQVKKPEPERSVDQTTAEDDERFERARALLQDGEDPVSVARQLDMGTAEVRMIARMLDQPDERS